MNQSTWNLLFGWAGKKCLLPEGCPAPTWAVFLVLAILILSAAFYGYRQLD